MSLCYANAAQIKIGTLIDTVGMVSDKTTFSGNSYSDNRSSNMIYTDKTLTNGGALNMKKSAQVDFLKESDTLQTDKIVYYNAGDSGAHMSASEYYSTYGYENNSDNSNVICIFGEDYADNSSHASIAKTYLSIMNARNLDLYTSTDMADGKLSTIHTISGITNNSTNTPAEATVISGGELQSGTSEVLSKTYERSLISGTIELLSKSYNNMNDVSEMNSIIKADGMVSEESHAIIEDKHINETNIKDYEGYAIKTSRILTNGGNLNDISSVKVSDDINADKMIGYNANGSSSSMQAHEFASVITSGSIKDYNSTAICVFSDEPSLDNTITSSKDLSAHSDIIGAESVQGSFATTLSTGSGISSEKFSYETDIRSHAGFNSSAFKSMNDLNNDGKYEDINGNGRIDFSDLVLMAKNFEGLNSSEYSKELDFNRNNRIDFSDLTYLFKKIQENEDD